MPKTTVGLLLAMLVTGCYTYVFQTHGPNQMARIDTLYALTAEDRFTIDTLGSNTMDFGTYNGHRYSDKPPGITYLALPAYTLTIGLQHAAHRSPITLAALSVALWTTTLSTSVLLSALGIMATWMLLSFFCKRPREALLGTLACWFGTLALPYGTMLFSHAAVIGLLSIAMAAILLPTGSIKRRTAARSWWWTGMRLGALAAGVLAIWTALRIGGFEGGMSAAVLALATLGLSANILLVSGTWHLVIGQGGADELRRRDALIGLACGIAVLCEFMAVFPAAALWVLLLTRDRKRAMRVALWALAPMLLLPLTNWLCFGSPFRLGYSTNSFTWMRSGFYGVTLLPSPSALLLLLFSGSKGLLFWSPCLALAIPGFLELHARDRALCWACAAGSALLLLAIAATGNPGGGWGVGPRYLAPMIPLLVLPMALGLRTLPRFGGLLIAVSIGLNAMATAVNPLPPPELGVPLTQFFLPALHLHRVLPNIGTLLGLSSLVGLLPAACFAAALTWVLWRLCGSMPHNRTGN